MSGIGQFFGNLFAPFGQLFHVVFFGPIFNVLMLLYEGVHAVAPGLPAFAIAIFLLTVAIRLCLYPLTRKQLQSSRAMQALQPQLQELQRKHKGDPQALMTAQRALQKEHGVSMAGGCLPMLIQLPFLYGLYYSLFAALIPPKLPDGKPLPLAEVPLRMLEQINNSIYPFLPHLSGVHALPSTTFLWADLGKVDHTFILPILAGVLTFIQMRMAQPVRKPGATRDPNTQAMSTMMYVMPFITVFFGLTFPAGLAFYWCISTGFSVVQQYFISGWGSLFVGIPGLEHLVPAPTVPQPLTPRPAGAAASALVAASPSTAAPTGLAGLRAMLRQLTTPPPIDDNGPPAANSNGANGKGGTKANAANGKGQGDAVATDMLDTGDSGVRQTGSNARRTRPDRTSPVLVKPPTSAANGSINGSINGSTNGSTNGAGNGARGATGAGGTSGGAGSGKTPGGGNGAANNRGGQAGRSGAKRRSGHRAKGGR